MVYVNANNVIHVFTHRWKNARTDLVPKQRHRILHSLINNSRLSSHHGHHEPYLLHFPVFTVHCHYNVLLYIDVCLCIVYLVCFYAAICKINDDDNNNNNNNNNSKKPKYLLYAN